MVNTQGKGHMPTRMAEDSPRLATLQALIRTQPLRGGDQLLRDPEFQNRLAEELRNQKLRSLAEFAGGASHEINNPLAIISGHAQYLLNHTENEKTQKALWTIIRQTERVNAILNDVMRFARLGEPRRDDFDVGVMLEQLVAEYAPIAEPKRIAVSSDALRGFRISGDEVQMKHACGCLLVNALEAVGTNGWVKFDAAIDPQGRMVVGIEDSGPGIDPAHLDHLFDPFFSGRSAGRGKGLGLSIAWRVAETHDGSIRHATIGNGPTRFEIELPEGRVLSNMKRLAA